MPRPLQRRRHRHRLPTLHRLLLLPALPRPIHTAVLAWQWDAKEETTGRSSLASRGTGGRILKAIRRLPKPRATTFYQKPRRYGQPKTDTTTPCCLTARALSQKASAQNLFMVSGGGLITPPESRS
jgi:hypothetical protein